MADNIGVVVTGDRKLALLFEEFPRHLEQRLLRRITSLTDALAARIIGAAPDKTGKLKSSIQTRVFDDEGKRITGYINVSDDFAKAGALEYGASKAISVKAHASTLDHAWADKLQTPISVMVSAHKRQQNLMARRFLRGPTGEMSAEITAALEAEVAAAAEEETA